ncbi:MAG: hypothetical protein IJO70_12290 [Lachnospiraceae bacterium]|nr:hypothetical protein [Lachnospiraceae bacterium]
MEAWEIQQRIRILKERRDEYQNEITRLKGKKERIKSEQTIKDRQKQHISNYYSSNRSNAGLLLEDLQGNAIKLALGEYSEIFGTGKEENVFSNIEMIQHYLTKNVENINERIECTKNNISSINWDIYCYEQQLAELESEVL